MNRSYDAAATSKLIGREGQPAAYRNSVVPPRTSSSPSIVHVVAASSAARYSVSSCVAASSAQAIRVLASAPKSIVPSPIVAVPLKVLQPALPLTAPPSPNTSVGALAPSVTVSPIIVRVQLVESSDAGSPPPDGSLVEPAEEQAETARMATRSVSVATDRMSRYLEAWARAGVGSGSRVPPPA